MILYYIISIMCIYLWIHDDPWWSMTIPHAMYWATDYVWPISSYEGPNRSMLNSRVAGCKDGQLHTEAILGHWWGHDHQKLLIYAYSCWFMLIWMSTKKCGYTHEIAVLIGKLITHLKPSDLGVPCFQTNPCFLMFSQSFVWLFSVYYFENVLQLFDIVWCYQVWLNVRISSKPTNMIEDCVKLGTSHFIVAMNCRSDLSCFRSYQSGLNM